MVWKPKFVSHEQLLVGEPVARDDGRFYIPLYIERDHPGLSNILLRVASDAFETLDETKKFADHLARVWNDQNFG